MLVLLSFMHCSVDEDVTEDTSIEDVIPGIKRRFTTYVWAITGTNHPVNYAYVEVLPRRYKESSNSYTMVLAPEDWEGFMEWNYYAY